MTIFKCKQTFSSKNGKYYRTEQTISESEFLKLDGWERNNFKQVIVDEEDVTSSIIDTAVAVSSLFNTFTSSSPSSNDDGGSIFDGFDGGDSGGGGATGDW